MWHKRDNREGEKVKQSIDDQRMLKDIQERVEKKIREQEIAVIAHWKERVEKILALKPEGIAPLMIELKNLSSMMANRIAAVKKELS